MSVNDDPMGVFHPEPRASLPLLAVVAGFVALIALVVSVVFVLPATTLLLETGYVDGVGAIVVLAVGVLAPPVLAFAVILLWGYRKAQSVEYRIYPDRVESETDFIGTKLKTTSIEDITDVAYSELPTDSYFGVGSLSFSTAGTDGSTVSFSQIEEAEELYDDVEKIVEADGDVDERAEFDVLERPSGW